MFSLTLRPFSCTPSDSFQMFVGSFGPDDFDSFMVDTVAAVTDLKSKGATRLLIDVTSNGGK